ncbi:MULTISPECIES: VirB3 family type IV secretion system protein [unclassified Pseudomonas]|uniref:VirB3 family type IV secretion system protein n=1 Tax=unclassified Pseudomonas TaxID=196821 RepID=UPI000C86DF70|nr:VirB3 family type IV secretion system protein [Pseudomonas sp. MPR-R2A5]PMU22993.1 type VI secretion protein [Pseudomonas sp. GP01-A9]PMU28575.1 type VI secretion protein [Pseudomonas sp. GP01-A13]PMU38827.1 type VI secretion protein [Pseudomonas sp. GP01-A8]PMU52445.1 type VI secretion protein [Pseudomonas sp. GP01-A6]PMU54442.1 type VI secretion protein [Pseudomonas sp. GP01-A14]PMU61484.1 type VI secretion protein [Pseudomonas sp. GP01-A3]PMU72958.1 type VI secretion protein [Pseudomon
MAEQNPDEGEVLVVAMARPSMVGPFTLSSILISLITPVLAALLLRSLYVLATMPILFAAAYWICSKDVYLFGVLRAAFKLRASRLRKLWGYRSYAPR